jgi:hypothetical protein
MVDPINLNKVRKAKAQSAARAQAAANRVAFGRTKAEKTAAISETEKAQRLLDGAKRDPEP